MRTYTKAQLAHWASVEVYRLAVTRIPLFLTELITLLPAGTLLSFEGELHPWPKPSVALELEDTPLLLRNTLAPELDFWIFSLQQESRHYLLQDFVTKVGMDHRVLHVLAEYQSKLLFGAHDAFHPESTHIACGATVPLQWLQDQQQKQTIANYQKLPVSG
ncbi:MAG TPA: hypothetical protein DCE41_29415 [Cytophagales bacterium]|nr:hypothetical protein [Cytophagales bacterium]HAA17411.1 hypothetical protein [Cytophagales bacterium]HAP58562.1 hypothetical protein [Cytophagales bacterium]